MRAGAEIETGEEDALFRRSRDRRGSAALSGALRRRFEMATLRVTARPVACTLPSASARRGARACASCRWRGAQDFPFFFFSVDREYGGALGVRRRRAADADVQAIRVVLGN